MRLISKELIREMYPTRELPPIPKGVRTAFFKTPIQIPVPRMEGPSLDLTLWMLNQPGGKVSSGKVSAWVNDRNYHDEGVSIIDSIRLALRRIENTNIQNPNELILFGDSFSSTERPDGPGRWLIAHWQEIDRYIMEDGSVVTIDFYTGNVARYRKDYTEYLKEIGIEPEVVYTRYKHRGGPTMDEITDALEWLRSHKGSRWRSLLSYSISKVFGYDEKVLMKGGFPGADVLDAMRNVVSDIAWLDRDNAVGRKLVDQIVKIHKDVTNNQS